MAEKQTIHESIGGLNAFRKISENFYNRVTTDPILRPLFPKKSEHASERLALFLAETFGGPNEYSRRRGMKSLQEMHARFQIDEEQIKAWKTHMLRAMQDAAIPRPALLAMRAYFCGHASSVDSVDSLWKLPATEIRRHLKENPSVGPRLLHRACGSTGHLDLDRVQFLLEAGVDPNTADSYEHTAIYFAANSSSSRGEIVRALLAHRASVNVHCGPTQSTPLHMAARRDNIAIGKLLIAAGADLEARDIKGHTPLRRALNCRQPGMTQLLTASGANLDAPDKAGVTPREYAATKAASRKLHAPLV
ncbi:MAG TPA: ankyrin repeat domain-containing protein [Verrucomicrobiae bacterium]|nr:ankyrin repeat domain-containing protein [Verrucomicrobiae bacterium]